MMKMKSEKLSTPRLFCLLGSLFFMMFLTHSSGSCFGVKAFMSSREVKKTFYLYREVNNCANSNRENNEVLYSFIRRRPQRRQRKNQHASRPHRNRFPKLQLNDENDNNSNNKADENVSSNNINKNIQDDFQKPCCKSPTVNDEKMKNMLTGLYSKTATASSSSSGQDLGQQQHQQILEIRQLLGRMSQLENIVASQQIVIRKLSEQSRELTESTKAFQSLIDLLKTTQNNYAKTSSSSDKVDNNSEEDDEDDKKDRKANRMSSTPSNKQRNDKMGTDDNVRTETDASIEDIVSIFGTAPETVLDAADVAGASILSGILAGKQRMLVDVRDAELRTNAATFVQFLELAVLPVAAGLEGLRGPRNRLKIVFPTVSELLRYRKTMCLSAPDVVALSTLGFDPVEAQDNIVVLIAPSPEDEEGLTKMNELLQLPVSDYDEYGRRSKGISKPVIVLNRHMLPMTGPAATFEVAYHLRLLSVQYVSGQDITTPAQSPSTESATTLITGLSNVDENMVNQSYNETSAIEREQALEAVLRKHDENYENFKTLVSSSSSSSFGVTRAMVIRAYPHSWNVFVDTSPDDTTADFEVAAVFAHEPTTIEIHNAIVTCLEGSEQEDDIVAHQMQQALEAGQLDRIAEFLSSIGDEYDELGDDDDDDDDDPYQSFFGEDSA